MATGTVLIDEPPSSPPQSAPRPRRQATLPAWLRGQALNLGRHLIALRPFTRQEFGTGAEAPSDGHILAVNQVMDGLRRELLPSVRAMRKRTATAIRTPTAEGLRAVVTTKHDAHRQVLAIEKVWDFYFELFGQRQSPYGSWLLSTDRIALDCYQDAYVGIGVHKTIPAPPPFSYMRTGFGPATYRRHIPMRALGRQLNPFPLIQLPYHRLVNPWTLGAVLHEVSHNLQSDLGLSKAVPLAIARALLAAGQPPAVAKVWARWNRETFADLSGLLLGGPCVVASLMDVVGRSPAVVFNYSPRAVHPIPYLRVLISCELLRRMGFPDDGARLAAAWKRIYPDPRGGGIPAQLLTSADAAIPVVVEAICGQVYPELGGKALREVFRFEPKEQKAIEEAAGRLAAGTDPGIVPARFLIGAARVAFDRRLAAPGKIRANFYQELSRR